MSWLFGILQKSKQSKFNFKLDEDFQKVELDNLFVAISKNSKTAFIKSTPTSISAYVGVPIIEENNKKKLLNKKSFYNSNSINVNNLFGHFVWLNYSNNVLELFTDTLGLRELYYVDSEKQFIFSTRIDLITKFLAEANIDIKEFSTLWLTNFQLSNNSIVNEIKRLGPGGEIIFSNSKIKISHNKFVKTTVKSPLEKFPRIISDYCSVEKDSHKVSLGLSGGIDARVILSFLLKSENDFSCHTIINEEDNDLKIASELCNTLDLRHKLIERENINLAEYEKDILQFYKNIPPKIPLTQLLDFGIYGKEYLQNYILQDGGFGEFYRRQYLSRIFLRGFSKFNLEKAENIKNILYAPKPQIFKDEVSIQLENSVDGFVKELISSFPIPRSENELAEILDLISINFMLPNVYSPGQIILDQNYISFMPLTQKDTINCGMNILFNEKSDSKMFKKIIKNSNSKLTRINLVKNNLENPFWLNNKLVMLRLVINRKFARQKNFERYRILYNSKEYILDLINDINTKNNEYLSYSENIKFTNQFFNGDLSKGSFVDWLCTFVLWSRANSVL